MLKNTQWQMQYRGQVVVFRKGEINHLARIITYVGIKKGKKTKLIRLLTNAFDMSIEDIILIYRRRWQIESLFKQIKTEFPIALLLWRKRKRHQNTNLGYIDSKYVDNTSTKAIGKAMELFRISNNDKNCSYVLHQP